MKGYIAVILLISVVIYNLTPVVTTVYYIGNYKIISENLCIRKEIKNNKCKGKCHLKKITQDLEETKNQTNANEKNKEFKTVIEWFFKDLVSPNFSIYFNFDCLKFPNQLVLKTISFSNKINHPPQVIS